MKKLKITSKTRGVSRIALTKSKHAILANLDEKLNPTEVMLLNHGLYAMKRTDEGFISRFTIGEFSDLYDLKPRKRELLKYANRLRKSGFTYFDYDFVDEKKVNKGRFITANLISAMTYEDGKITIYWDSGQGRDRLLEDIEETTFIVDLLTLSKLTPQTAIFYELLKVSSTNETRVLRFSGSELASLLKLQGRSTITFKYINDRYLKPAVKELNELTELNVKMEKTGTRGNWGVEFSWSVDKLEFSPSEKQLNVLKSLKVDYEKHANKFVGNTSYQKILNQLNDLELLTKNEAGRLINLASTNMKHFRKFVNENSLIDTEDIKLIYQDILDLWQGSEISNKEVGEFTAFISLFNEEDRYAIGELAVKISKRKKAQKFSYVNKVLKNWLNEKIYTYKNAYKNYMEHFGGDDDELVERMADRKVTLSPDFLEAMNVLWKE